MSEIDEVGGVGGAKKGNYMHSDARYETEMKMAKAIAESKAKTNNAQNSNAGTSSNQTDYNKKASDEISVGQTNMDGTYATANNIRTGDQTNFGGSDSGTSNGGGKGDSVEAVKLASAKHSPNEIDFGTLFKKKFGDEDKSSIGVAKSIVNRLGSGPDGIKDIHTNKQSAENISNALASIHEKEGKEGLNEVRKNLQKK